MAAENEATCESDPNFAVICGFLEKFGGTCGLANIDFLDLQQMLENTHEVPQELVELHIKLLRKARKSVSNERWEKALINLCHSYCSQDAWEIERFGYKKARISSKLRILKQLLEMQFDFNAKFKNEINKMSATELRSQPLGRDKLGCAYWYQADDNCQVRVYKDDPDEETWTLVAKDREGLLSLISELGSGDSVKVGAEVISNEDSSSIEIEKPILDTGQNSSPTEDMDKSNSTNTNSSDSKDDECKEDTSPIDEVKSNSNTEIKAVEEEEEENNVGLDLTIKPTINLRIKPIQQLLAAKPNETLNIKDKYMREDKVMSSIRRAVNSADFDINNPDIQQNDEEDNIEEEQPIKKLKLCRPTLLNNRLPNNELSEPVEEPVMFIKGYGNGTDNYSPNKRFCHSLSPVIVSETIEEAVFYVVGEGNGYDLQTGNEKKQESDNSENKNEEKMQDSNSIKDSDIDKKLENCNSPSKIYKLGTVIDVKTDHNRTFTPSKKVSRWDISERDTVKMNDIKFKDELFPNTGQVQTLINKWEKITEEVNSETTVTDTESNITDDGDHSMTVSASTAKQIFFFGPQSVGLTIPYSTSINKIDKKSISEDTPKNLEESIKWHDNIDEGCSNESNTFKNEKEVNEEREEICKNETNTKIDSINSDNDMPSHTNDSSCDSKNVPYDNQSQNVEKHIDATPSATKINDQCEQSNLKEDDNSKMESLHSNDHKDNTEEDNKSEPNKSNVAFPRSEIETSKEFPSDNKELLTENVTDVSSTEDKVLQQVEEQIVTSESILVSQTNSNTKESDIIEPIVNKDVGVVTCSKDDLVSAESPKEITEELIVKKYVAPLGEEDDSKSNSDSEDNIEDSVIVEPEYKEINSETLDDNYDGVIKNNKELEENTEKCNIDENTPNANENDQLGRNEGAEIKSFDVSKTKQMKEKQQEANLTIDSTENQSENVNVKTGEDQVNVLKNEVEIFEEENTCHSERMDEESWYLNKIKDSKADESEQILMNVVESNDKCTDSNLKTNTIETMEISKTEEILSKDVAEQSDDKEKEGTENVEKDLMHMKEESTTTEIEANIDNNTKGTLKYDIIEKLENKETENVENIEEGRIETNENTNTEASKLAKEVRIHSIEKEVQSNVAEELENKEEKPGDIEDKFKEAKDTTVEANIIENLEKQKREETIEENVAEELDSKELKNNESSDTDVVVITSTSANLDLETRIVESKSQNIVEGVDNNANKHDNKESEEFQSIMQNVTDEFTNIELESNAVENSEKCDAEENINTEIQEYLNKSETRTVVEKDMLEMDNGDINSNLETNVVLESVDESDVDNKLEEMVTENVHDDVKGKFKNNIEVKDKPEKIETEKNEKIDIQKVENVVFQEVDENSQDDDINITETKDVLIATSNIAINKKDKETISNIEDEIKLDFLNINKDIDVSNKNIVTATNVEKDIKESTSYDMSKKAVNLEKENEESRRFEKSNEELTTYDLSKNVINLEKEMKDFKGVKKSNEESTSYDLSKNVINLEKENEESKIIEETNNTTCNEESTLYDMSKGVVNLENEMEESKVDEKSNKDTCNYESTSYDLSKKVVNLEKEMEVSKIIETSDEGTYKEESTSHDLSKRAVNLEKEMEESKTVEKSNYESTSYDLSKKVVNLEKEMEVSKIIETSDEDTYKEESTSHELSKRAVNLEKEMEESKRVEKSNEESTSYDLSKKVGNLEKEMEVSKIIETSDEDTYKEELTSYDLSKRAVNLEKETEESARLEKSDEDTYNDESKSSDLSKTVVNLEKEMEESKRVEKSDEDTHNEESTSYDLSKTAVNLEKVSEESKRIEKNSKDICNEDTLDLSKTSSKTVASILNYNKTVEQLEKNLEELDNVTKHFVSVKEDISQPLVDETKHTPNIEQVIAISMKKSSKELGEKQDSDLKNEHKVDEIFLVNKNNRHSDRQTKTIKNVGKCKEETISTGKIIGNTKLLMKAIESNYVEKEVSREHREIIKEQEIIAHVSKVEESRKICDVQPPQVDAVDLTKSAINSNKKYASSKSEVTIKKTSNKMHNILQELKNKAKERHSINKNKEHIMENTQELIMNNCKDTTESVELQTKKSNIVKVEEISIPQTDKDFTVTSTTDAVKTIAPQRPLLQIEDNNKFQVSKDTEMNKNQELSEDVSKTDTKDKKEENVTIFKIKPETNLENEEMKLEQENIEIKLDLNTQLEAPVAETTEIIPNPIQDIPQEEPNVDTPFIHVPDYEDDDDDFNQCDPFSNQSSRSNSFVESDMSHLKETEIKTIEDFEDSIRDVQIQEMEMKLNQSEGEIKTTEDFEDSIEVKKIKLSNILTEKPSSPPTVRRTRAATRKLSQLEQLPETVQNEEQKNVEVVKEKPLTLANFQIDADIPSPPSSRVTRKRGHCSPEIQPVIAEAKRPKLKAKRTIDTELRKSIEIKKSQEKSSSEEDSAVTEVVPTPPLPPPQETVTVKKTKSKRKKGKKKAKKKSSGNKAPSNANNSENKLNESVPSANEVEADVGVETKENVEKSPKKTTPTAKKRTRLVMGLELPLEMELGEEPVSGVRQSRRIAQIKIKEEAERRKMEELALEEIQKKHKNKKDDDKDYKGEKKRKSKSDIIDDEASTEQETDTKKKKKKRKHRNRKLFDESNPWRSSSDSSTSNEEEEEEEIADYTDEDEKLVFKSDHEFSPESDLEDNVEIQPLKRARTVRKESDVEAEVDDCNCQKCGKADHPEWILLCDGCDFGWHCSCLRPPLLVIPEGDWYCPPCQHLSLIKQIQLKLDEYDKKLNKRELDLRRKERLAYVGISLDNVLPPSKEEKKLKREDESESTSDDESESETDESSSSGSDSDEPIYQLRQRRQAHSYRFNDYDELINSAIQDEMNTVKPTVYQSRGKDISTIINADKVENSHAAEIKTETEELPPLVPKTAESLEVAPETTEEKPDSEDDIKPVVRKPLRNKKHRRLNSLDISSDDDEDSDEDFKGNSSDEEDDDFDDDFGSESSEDFGRKRGGPIRRSTRARTSRYDKDFINDDDDDSDVAPRKRKTRSIWDDESESEESDKSWGRRRRKSSKKTRRFSPPKPSKKKVKKKKKNRDDSDVEVYKKKKPKIKYGGLEDEEIGRRTRGKKITYIDALGSDSDEDTVKKAPPKIEDSEDEYVLNEDEEENDKDSDDLYEDEEEDDYREYEVKIGEPITPFSNNLKPNTEEPLPPILLPVSQIEVTPDPVLENKLIPPINSSIFPLDSNQEFEEPNPIEEINKNVEAMDMEMMIEDEEYANKQLQLVAVQIEKERKRKEKEAAMKEQFLQLQEQQQQQLHEQEPQQLQEQQLQEQEPQQLEEEQQEQLEEQQLQEEQPQELQEQEQQQFQQQQQLQPQQQQFQQQQQLQPQQQLQLQQQQMQQQLQSVVTPEPKVPKKRGRKPKNYDTQIGLMTSPVSIPTVIEAITPSTVTGPVNSENSEGETPKKRRGRGKGKKTLAAEAAAAAAAAAAANSNTDSSQGLETPNATETLQGGKLGIATPPQPFSQTQPTPSVITRMLQNQQTQSPFANNPNGGAKFYGSAGQTPLLTKHLESAPNVTTTANSFAGNLPGPRGVGVQFRPTATISYLPRGVQPNIPVAQGIPRIFHHPIEQQSPGTPGVPGRSSPSTVPTTGSPLSTKSSLTPPPPPYSRPQLLRFPPPNTVSPLTNPPTLSSRSMIMGHIQSPRGRLSPHQSNIPPNYHFPSFSPNINEDVQQPPAPPPQPPPNPSYNNPPYDQFSADTQSGDNKIYEEDGEGEFGGLVSYFSSQREDDLDT